MTTECRIYRCSKQEEMYLYLRADLTQDALPAALLSRLGRLIEVMTLDLTKRERLARVDIQQVAARLASDGFYLQMPPQGELKAFLYEGD